MENETKKKKKNRKSNGNEYTEVITVRMTKETRKMLKSLIKPNLEKEPDTLRRVIVESYERNNSENVAVNG